MSSPVFASLESLVRKVMRRVDYCALYACTVQAQRSDGSLDLKPQDDRVPAMTGVPIRIGVPGLAVKVAPGAEVLMGFDGYRPDKPYAALWGAQGLKELVITASVKVTVDAPTVEITATTATVDAQSVTIAGGVQGAARMGDDAICGPFAGKIVSGSTKVLVG